MYSLGIVTQAFLGIILTLDTWVYSLISSAYKIFMAIASARILSSDAYTAIANKVYVIIGVGMLFVLAYAIMKAIIDPDQMSKGDMAGGKILKSIAVAVIGLIVTPLLFDLAYMAQGKMLEDDILGKLFFRTGESTVESLTGGDPVNYDEELQNTGGAVAAVSVWRAFFYPVDGEDPDKIIADPEIARLNATVSAVGCAALAIGTAVAAYFSAGLALVVGGGAVASCITAVQKDEAADKIEEAAKDGEVSLSEAYVMVASGESFAIFQAFLDPVDEGQIRYTWFISTVCGAFVAYAFVSYAIDMGLRAAKLAYYQIIAPVPLILGVLPKNGDTVGKFAKGVLSTFMEVFVRISVVYIVVYIIAHLNELFSTVGALWDNENLTNVESLIAMALLIIGLVLFAKEAPKIIGETFGLKGDSGLKGLNIMDKLRRGEVFTAGTIAGSAIKSGVQNATRSWNNHPNRGFGGRVLGAAGSMIGGTLSGGVRSGVGRARSGKAVGGFREMSDNVDRTARELHDKRQKRDDFNRVNDTMDKKVSAVSGIVSGKIKTWATGDIDNGSIDRQEKAYAYVRDMAGKLEGTVGNDALVKEANRRIGDLSTYESAQRTLFNEIRDNLATKTDAEIASITGMETARVAAIRAQIAAGGAGASDYTTITNNDIVGARDAADEALKVAKKDAVSRKIAEAHMTGVENDTSRMARQLLSSREFLKYADEFDNLAFDVDPTTGAEITFGQFLRSNFGNKVTVNGEVDFAQMFEHQTDAAIGGQPRINVTLKPGAMNAADAARLGFAAGTRYEDLNVEYDLAGRTVEITDRTTGATNVVSVDDFRQTSAEAATSFTADATGAKRPSKKTVFGRAKDQGEVKGDQFTGSDYYRNRKAAEREADKNKGGNK